MQQAQPVNNNLIPLHFSFPRHDFIFKTKSKQTKNTLNSTLHVSALFLPHLKLRGYLVSVYSLVSYTLHKHE